MSAWPIPHMRPARPGRPAARGFTLIEVLIALTLLSLLMLALTGAMRAMGQTSEGVERRIEAEDDYRIAQAFLRDILAQASARVSDQAAAGGRRGWSVGPPGFRATRAHRKEKQVCAHRGPRRWKPRLRPR